MTLGPPPLIDGSVRSLALASGFGDALFSFLEKSELHSLMRALKTAPDALPIEPSRLTLLALIIDGVRAAAARWLHGVIGASIYPGGFAAAVPTLGDGASAILVPGACGLASVSVFRGDSTTWADVFDEAESWSAMRSCIATEGDELPSDAALWRAMHDLGVAESASAQAFPSFSLCGKGAGVGVRAY